MPRYFFNIHHETGHLDAEGEELPDVHAAWKEATVTAGQMLQDIDGKLKPGHDWRMEVTDEFANTLFVLQVSAKGRLNVRLLWNSSPEFHANIAIFQLDSHCSPSEIEIITARTAAFIGDENALLRSRLPATTTEMSCEQHGRH